MVLQVLPHLGPGGTARGAIEVATAQTEAGWTALVASAGGDGERALAKIGARHIALPLDSKNPVVMGRNTGRLARLITDEGVDLVHARSRAPAWSAHAAARRTGRGFVTTFHGTYGHGSWLKRRYNRIMTRGDRVIAISNHIAEHIRAVYGIDDDRLRVIHRGVDPELFDPGKVGAERLIALASQWRLADGMPVIMMPARLARWKGHTVLIEALARLGREDLRCLLIGDTQGHRRYRRELERLIARRGLVGVVHLLDHCRDMPAAYMLADAVVSASTEPEAFGRVVIEAQAMGRPVVVSDHGGGRETVIEGQTGWTVRPGDPDALAAGLAAALALSSAEREAVVKAANAHVRRHYTTPRMCAQTLATYREVLAMAAPKT
jgi:glycosyltransferase involved in cell wall biosynthesis